jgi:L-fuculose-phosphate aldolase
MEKTESQHRSDIIDICKRVHANGWVAANDGNVSIKLGPNTVICTPTGMSKGYLTSDQLIKVDMDGNKIDGEMEPSSEVKMHLDVYKSKENIGAVVHAHPPFSTGFAVAGIALDECIMPEIIISLGSIPLTRFGTPSTSEIPDNIRPYLKEHDVFLLENHGALSIGKDVYQAYYRMESLELFAKINLVARMLGNVNVIGEDNVRKMIGLREKFGLENTNYPGCRIDGKFIKSGDAESEQFPGDSIVITRDKLIKLVTIIVSKILAGNDLRAGH